MGVLVNLGKPNTFPGIAVVLLALLRFELLDELDDFTELELLVPRLELMLTVLLDLILERLLNELETRLDRETPEEILVALLDTLSIEEELKSTGLLEFRLTLDATGLPPFDDEPPPPQADKTNIKLKAIKAPFNRIPEYIWYFLI